MIAGAAALPAAAMGAMPAVAQGGGFGLSPEPWLTVAAEVAAPQILGRSEGFERRCVPILGGTVSGRATGTVLPGGADWQRVLPDGTTELDAHYTIRTAAGDMIEVKGSGLRSGSETAMRALLAGEKVDPALIYFRGAYRLITAAPALRDLTTRLFIGIGVREPARVLIALHAVE